MNAEELLAELDAERSKYTRSDKVKMELLCKSLVDIGVYPAVSKINMTALAMVEAWGVNWHIWQEPFECRHCGVDLRNHETGTPFKKEIAVVVHDRCDRFMCPNCNKTIVFCRK